MPHLSKDEPLQDPKIKGSPKQLTKQKDMEKIKQILPFQQQYYLENFLISIKILSINKQ